MSGRDRVVAAEACGTIVGVIVLRVAEAEFLIDNIAVHPLHRGRGLGTALLELAEAEARDAGLPSICLYTHEKMTENIKRYARMGYVEYHRGPRKDSRSFACASSCPDVIGGP